MAGSMVMLKPFFGFFMFSVFLKKRLTVGIWFFSFPCLTLMALGRHHSSIQHLQINKNKTNFKNIKMLPSKSNIELLCDPTILLLGI